MRTAADSPDEMLKPGRQCWRIEKANYASIIVDYANYYRDLHQSICKAEKSIFILGWDIDGRIELLRGEDAEKSLAPTRLFDLIKWKTETNPNVKIYLNKWDYSLFFAKEREPFAGFHWHRIKSPNFHYCIDSMLPLGACHHQKISVIDDEVAYCGGMDIALARWDFREHHPINPHRQDPSGFLHPHSEVPFAPYHDLMMVTSGQAAKALAMLVRDRWKLACKSDPLPLDQDNSTELPVAWPDSDPPDFKNVSVAIARTLPPIRRRPRVEEIIAAYIKEISQAEKFIYIENQFLVQKDIAQALNKRLRERPALRILAISCDHPKGIMEKKSMWTPRLKFREIVESGGVASRVALCHPISREDGREDPVRIHSKLMIIDDTFLHLGSANINNRSMGMDTECDQIVFGEDEKTRAKIAAIRTDLIREHSGREAHEIDRLIEEGALIEDFLIEVATSRQHLIRINDEPYRHEHFVTLARFLSDPRRPFITADLTIPLSKHHFRKNISKPWVLILSLIILLSVFGYFMLTANTMSVSMTQTTEWFEHISKNPFSFFIILALFIISGITLFPITILIAGTSAAFGPFYGFALSTIGTLLSASIGYGIGRKIGFAKVNHMFGQKADRLKEKINHSGVIGVAFIRMLPISPFGVMNILFGINATPFSSYVIGTLLGILPGTLVMAFLGSSLLQLFKNPEPRNIAYVILGTVAWCGVIWVSHSLEKKLHRNLA